MADKETLSTPDVGKGGVCLPSTIPGSRAYFALGMLCFIYVLNFLDRQLLSILAKPIQDALLVSDSQLGLIGGLYFAFFYCFIAIPVGWLADKTNRVRVVSIACVLWSAATVACGLAKTYPQLVVARMTVGVGEAGGVPPSYAILSDYFPPGRRGSAIGIYNMGPPIGAALGIAFGASIAAAYSWRHAFVFLGAVGIFAALLLAIFVKEPKRGGLDVATDAKLASDNASDDKAGFGDTLKMFFTTPSLLLISLGSGATQFITYGMGNFTVLFLMREKGMELSEVALYYALVVGIGMGGGIYASGKMIDKFTKRSKQAYALLPALALVLAIPLYAGFVWAPSWGLALLFLLGPSFLNYFYFTSAVTLVQETVRPNQRVMSGALLLFVMNMIGLGFGPTYVGFASDFFRATYQDNSLQIALYSLIPFYFLAIFLFLWLSRILKKENSQAAEVLAS